MEAVVVVVIALRDVCLQVSSDLCTSRSEDTCKRTSMGAISTTVLTIAPPLTATATSIITITMACFACACTCRRTHGPKIMATRPPKKTSPHKSAENNRVLQKRTRRQALNSQVTLLFCRRRFCTGCTTGSATGSAGAATGPPGSATVPSGAATTGSSGAATTSSSGASGTLG